MMYVKIFYIKPREHPLINEQLLDYAVTKAILLNKEFSKDIPNPLEVIFFDITNIYEVIDRSKYFPWEKQKR